MEERNLPALWQSALEQLCREHSPLPLSDGFGRRLHPAVTSLQQRVAGDRSLTAPQKRLLIGAVTLAEALKHQLAPTPKKAITLDYCNPLTLAMACLPSEEPRPLMICDAEIIDSALFTASGHSADDPGAGGAPNKNEQKLPLTLNSLIVSAETDEGVSTTRKVVPFAHIIQSGAQQALQSLSSLNDDHWLTIVIPTLRKDSVTSALNSIERQTIKGITVIVLHADAANVTEPTRHAADTELRRQDCNEIHYVSSRDRGPYDAMNLGLKLAATPWVYFMGDDDELAATSALEKIKNAAESSAPDVSMIYGNVEMVGAGHGTHDGQIYDYQFTYEQLQRKSPCHQSIFYRAASLRALGGFDLRYPVCADWDANIRLWNKGAEPQFIDTTVAKFVRGGISSTEYDKRFFGDLPHIWAAHQHT